MTSPWFSYLPHYLASELLDSASHSPIGLETRFQAATLFADVSGFTAISEALGSSGKGGAEELTAILNGYFSPMISLIREYGGMIAKFGGDAMTVVFPYTPEDARHVARRAITCALEMQARMHQYAAIETSAGTFGLAMKAGLACGTLFRTVVGDAALRLEHILAGQALDRCAEAEHHATRGEVVVHRDLCTLTGNFFPVREQRDDFCLVQAAAQPEAPAPLPALPDPPEYLQPILAAFIHPSIARRLAQEQEAFINEHRKVTVIFLRFDAFSYDDDPLVGARLQNYFAHVINIVERYGGYLNKIDMGDKGSKAIILFGAPIAHEDDAERALRCALEIRDLPQAAEHIGVNTGYAFCGQVGSSERREYTVMGDAVNLAARLMQAARPNQILVSEYTRQAVPKGFAWDEAYSLRVKGKRKPVHVAALLQRSVSTVHLQEPRYSLPMVGRQEELALIRQKLNHILLGQGQIVGITAEAGMGKSRLAAEVIRIANQRGFTAYGGECLSHGSNTPYLVWQPILRDFFDVRVAMPLATQLSNLKSALAAISLEMANRMPLLGRALNITIPDNEVTAGMDPKLRKTALEDMIVQCLRHRSAAAPLLLVLENTHWIDPLSNDLLEALARNIADVPVIILTMYRPAERYEVQPAIKRFAHFTEIALREFTLEEAARLIALKWGEGHGEQELPHQLVQRITERSQGNPFYIDEIVNLIRDSGIDIQDSQALEHLELPDSLHSLVLSRIDRLLEEHKTILKVASIIGRSFRAAWLWGIYPKVGAPSRVLQNLEELNRLDITPLDKPAPELQYLFKHIVTREVAYESLALSTRQFLHEQAGRFIEHTYPEHIERYLDLLAYHYGNSQNTEKQRLYFRKAGDAAKAAYANRAALEYYRRLLPLLDESEQCDIYLALGEIYQLTGEWDAARDAAQQILRIAQKQHDRRWEARAYHLEGKVLMLHGEYGSALERYQQALEIFQAAGMARERAAVTLDISIVYWSQSDYPRALEILEEAENIARRHTFSDLLLRSLGNLGLVYTNLGQYDLAMQHLQESYHVAREQNDRFRASRLLINIGNIHMAQGNHTQAMLNYLESTRIAREIGERQALGTGIGNMGSVYVHQGEYTAALACTLRNLQTVLELGDTLGVAFGLWNMSEISLAKRQLHGAQELVQRAITIERLLNTPYGLCGALHTLGRILAAQQKYQEAYQYNHEALTIAEEIEYREIHFQAAIGEIRLLHAMGKLDSAQAIEQLLALQARLQDENQDEKEAAEVAYRIWKLDPGRETARQQAAELYRALYTKVPDIEYRERYADLTGNDLPDPPPLPPLPEYITEGLPHISTLLKLVDALIVELQSEQDSD